MRTIVIVCRDHRNRLRITKSNRQIRGLYFKQVKCIVPLKSRLSNNY